MDLGDASPSVLPVVPEPTGPLLGRAELARVSEIFPSAQLRFFVLERVGFGIGSPLGGRLVEFVAAMKLRAVSVVLRDEVWAKDSFVSVDTIYDFQDKSRKFPPHAKRHTLFSLRTHLTRGRSRWGAVYTRTIPFQLHITYTR